MKKLKQLSSMAAGELWTDTGKGVGYEIKSEKPRPCFGAGKHKLWPRVAQDGV